MADIGAVEVLEDLVDYLAQAGFSLVDVDHVPIVSAVDVCIQPTDEMRFSGSRPSNDGDNPVSRGVPTEQRVEYVLFADCGTGVQGGPTDIFAENSCRPMDCAKHRRRI